MTRTSQRDTILVIAIVFALQDAPGVVPNVNGGATSQTTARAAEGCDAWEREVSQLRPDEREMLRTKGVAFSGGLVIGPDIAKDCSVRLRLGRYWGSLITGQDTRSSFPGRAVLKSSGTYRILERVWFILSDPKFPSDGAFFSDKYNLLADPGLGSEPLRPLLARIIREQGVNGELAWVVSKRGATGLKPELENAYALAAKSQNFEAEVYTLFCLSLENVDMLPRLRRLESDKVLTDNQRRFADQIASVLLSHKRLKFEDVEQVSYLEPARQ